MMIKLYYVLVIVLLCSVLVLCESNTEQQRSSDYCITKAQKLKAQLQRFSQLVEEKKGSDGTLPEQYHDIADKIANALRAKALLLKESCKGTTELEPEVQENNAEQQPVPEPSESNEARIERICAREQIEKFITIGKSLQEKLKANEYSSIEDKEKDRSSLSKIVKILGVCRERMEQTQNNQQPIPSPEPTTQPETTEEQVRPVPSPEQAPVPAPTPAIPIPAPATESVTQEPAPAPALASQRPGNQYRFDAATVLSADCDQELLDSLKAKINEAAKQVQGYKKQDTSYASLRIDQLKDQIKRLLAQFRELRSNCPTELPAPASEPAQAPAPKSVTEPVSTPSRDPSATPPSGPGAASATEPAAVPASEPESQTQPAGVPSTEPASAVDPAPASARNVLNNPYSFGDEQATVLEVPVTQVLQTTQPVAPPKQPMYNLDFD
jgi:gas vesicle protein